MNHLQVEAMSLGAQLMMISSQQKNASERWEIR